MRGISIFPRVFVLHYRPSFFNQFDLYILLSLLLFKYNMYSQAKCIECIYIKCSEKNLIHKMMISN